jgi:hypothetical protein
MILRKLFLPLSAVALLAGCSASSGSSPAAAKPADHAAARGTSPMDRIAESYVKLVLAVGQYDPDYVDAYYGPPEWKAEAEAQKRPLADLQQEARSLIDELDALPAAPAKSSKPAKDAELTMLRQHYLKHQLLSMVVRIDLLQGKKLAFDQESQGLYDAVAPVFPPEHFQKMLDRLGRLLPGEGPIGPRYEKWRQSFVIPRDKLDSVFQAAIGECRKRTLAHVQLPPGESFTVEYVNDKPWSAYNWYKGGYHSVIQVNTDLPIFMDRAIDLACHEGYPGHHVYNALLEKNLVRDRGWPEYSVYALFSPQSLIAEGSANFGIEVAFPGEERMHFERDVLYPLAGLDPARAEEYARIQGLVQQLTYAGNEAARGYLNGEMTREQAAEYIQRYALYEPERALQRTRFIDKYRSYVINYNLGQDLIRQYVERQGGTADRPDQRWLVFQRILSSPRLPSDLQ